MSKRKAFNFYRSYFEVFSELPEKDKLPFIKALLNRQFNGQKPIGLDGMAKFAYLSQEHSIDAQVKGWEDKTGVQLSGNQASQGGTQGGCQGPSVQEKEKEKEKEKEQLGIFDFRKNLISIGVEEKIVSDWLIVRRNKKASNTQTAFNKIRSQIKLSGLTANECIKIAVENDWKGFQASWISLTNGYNNSKHIRHDTDY